MSEDQLDGNRPLPFDRDQLGRLVREAWVRWAKTQPNPKPDWLLPYDELSEPDKEADRHIGETLSRWTLIGDAARVAQTSAHLEDLAQWAEAAVELFPVHGGKFKEIATALRSGRKENT